ncbi:uncharacterized protein LOC123669044 [Melitaea cinxia]|uniref:uncharacterized protein LOC123669044 n=1 Tax=Melitaea cinxia TaxID=113334 RepID=UPI001E27339D|nr:uncharacterized protein LOC123669044 [Melitaea cinxia]
MADSTMYSSLFALVDSHLSKSSVQDNGENTEDTSFKVPSFKIPPLGSLSESSLTLPPCQRVPISQSGMNEKPIQSVLAEQVANMLKAKELKKQEEERLKIEEEIKRLKIEDEKNSVIDLMTAIQIPSERQHITYRQEPLTTSSSCESLFNLNFADCDDDEPQKTKTPEPLLPCNTDMSYILKQKIKRDKGSPFGKVLTSRLRPVAAPYLNHKYPTSIVRFAFNTPSPCDIIKANLRKPTMSSTFTININDFN